MDEMLDNACKALDFMWSCLQNPKYEYLNALQIPKFITSNNNERSSFCKVDIAELVFVSVYDILYTDFHGIVKNPKIVHNIKLKLIYKENVCIETQLNLIQFIN